MGPDGFSPSREGQFSRTVVPNALLSSVAASEVAAPLSQTGEYETNKGIDTEVLPCAMTALSGLKVK